MMISAGVQSEKYVYHSRIESSRVSATSPNMVGSDCIAYRAIGRIRPGTQEDIIRRFDMTRKEVNSRPMHIRIEPQTSTRNVPQYYRNLLSAEKSDAGIPQRNPQIHYY